MDGGRRVTGREEGSSWASRQGKTKPHPYMDAADIASQQAGISHAVTYEYTETIVVVVLGGGGYQITKPNPLPAPLFPVSGLSPLHRSINIGVARLLLHS